MKRSAPNRTASCTAAALKRNWPVPVLVILADHLTKRLARGLTAPSVLIPGILGLHLTRNTGVAFSLFRDIPVVPVVISCALILLFPLIFLKLKPRGAEAFGLALMFGGAAANLTERLLYGWVTDMLELLFVAFPVFNVADICLTAGCAITALTLLFPAKKENENG